MGSNTLKIDYDDNALDIMDKVNAILAKVGLEFVNDEQEHDGWEIFELKPIPADPSKS